MASRGGAVHVATTKRIYKGRTYQTHLLRRTFREDGKVKHETLGNLSHLPAELIELIRAHLAGKPTSQGDWEIIRSYPHGHVAAVLGTLKKLKLDQMIDSRASRQRDLVVALIVSRILDPRSKLAMTREHNESTAGNSMALEISPVGTQEIYPALDWLLERQARIEKKLAQQHLQDGTLILYDVSGSYYTGRQSSLIKHGYSRDGRADCPQIVYGLLCNADGCPVAIEVFAGNTSDSLTLGAQVQKVRERFGVQQLILVGDRGMITSRRIEQELRSQEGVDWITALRADSIKALVTQGTIQRSLFDERDLAEVTSDNYPGERLIVCRNPLLADERARKRNELLAATEKKLNAVVAATARTRRPLRGQDRIGLRVGRILNAYKMAKHFLLQITNDSFSFARDHDKINAEAALDGIYVIRTSVPQESLPAPEVVRSYKQLAKVERAFRSLKTMDLRVRPIFHWLDDRIRAHVFLCMLAYYVEWHMRQRLAPILFDDHQRSAAESSRTSIVAPAPRSLAAQQKDQLKVTAEGWPVHSFHSLLKDLATLAKNRVRIIDQPQSECFMLTQPTPLQKHIFQLLGLSL